MTKKNVLREGIKVLFKELGHVKTIEFFQLLGINKGNTLKEIESITEKLSKEEVLYGIRKTITY